MAWLTKAEREISSITEQFPEIETDYVDPVLYRSLAEHLKPFWLLRQMHDYSQGYEAAKVKEYLEPEKFTEKDWFAISTICDFKRSWAFKQMEEWETR